MNSTLALAKLPAEYLFRRFCTRIWVVFGVPCILVAASDQTKVSAIATRKAQSLAQLEVLREELQAKIYNTVLTSDQKAKVDQMRQKQLDRINQRLQGNASTTPE